MELFTYKTVLDQPRGSILLAHGFGEHHRRYEKFIAEAGAVGFDVHSFDFLAHGSNQKHHSDVHVARLIRQHLEAREVFAATARSENLYLFGHSMGGLITLASTLLMPTNLSAVAVTGPALRPLPPVNRHLARTLLGVARTFPHIKTIGLDTSKLSHDPQVEESYLNDPDVYKGKVPLLTASSMIVEGNYVLENAPILAVPTLLLHGGADELADPAGSIEFARKAGDNAEIEIFPGEYHELLNETNREQYSVKILEWFTKW